MSRTGIVCPQAACPAPSLGLLASWTEQRSLLNHHRWGSARLSPRCLGRRGSQPVFRPARCGAQYPASSRPRSLGFPGVHPDGPTPNLYAICTLRVPQCRRRIGNCERTPRSRTALPSHARPNSVGAVRSVGGIVFHRRARGRSYCSTKRAARVCRLTASMSRSP